jgi:hypothetical protein
MARSPPCRTGGRAATPERRLAILPPGERERRQAVRIGAVPTGASRTSAAGAERRSGHDDRQADRRDHSNAPPASA